MVRRSKGFRSLLVLVICAAVVILLMHHPGGSSDPLIELPLTAQMPRTIRDRIEQCIPNSAGWAWAWQLEQALFGKRKSVNVELEVVHLVLVEQELQEACGGSIELETTNGLRARFLTPVQLRSLREKVRLQGAEFLARPRVSTADGIQADMVVAGQVNLGETTSEIGMHMRCYPRTRAASTDMRIYLTCSGLVTNQLPHAEGALRSVVSVITNVNTAFRIQIPKGKGALLVTPTIAGAGDTRATILISPPQP